MYLLHFLSVDDVYVKIHMDDGRTIYFYFSVGSGREMQEKRQHRCSNGEKKKEKKRNVIHIWMDDDDDGDQMMEIIMINV